MNNQQRRDNRYKRRKQERDRRKAERSENLGSIEQVFSFYNLFKAGKKCCNGVRWKASVQNFERHLFSITAKQRKAVLSGKWKPSKYSHFTITERGKTREIDAPSIRDRQIHKVLTKQVILPLYLPDMIYNNGASLEGKGFHFSIKRLKKELRAHYRKYGRKGSIILLDFKKFFPSAPHKTIYARHDKLIQNADFKKMANEVVATVKGDCGLPLGVELSQAEMIALPSPVDNHVKCQLSMKGAGHYMDDYYMLVPPEDNAKALLDKVETKAKGIGLIVNRAKTKIKSLIKPFRFCKARFKLTGTGKVICNGNAGSVKRARRKIKSFSNQDISKEDLGTSVRSSLAYFENYNDHNRLLKLRRLFYAKFGFSAEDINNFKEKENGIYRTQKV